MVRPRVVETDQGIQGDLTVSVYDQMQRRFHNRGWIETGGMASAASPKATRWRWPGRATWAWNG